MRHTTSVKPKVQPKERIQIGFATTRSLKAKFVRECKRAGITQHEAMNGLIRAFVQSKTYCNKVDSSKPKLKVVTGRRKAINS